MTTHDTEESHNSKEHEEEAKMTLHKIPDKPQILEPIKCKHKNGPKTPNERPVILPGGRKWRNPRDAYNDEFIAEVMSSQAELINGSTLG